jgi:hypothetical protein
MNAKPRASFLARGFVEPFGFAPDSRSGRIPRILVEN